MGGHLAPPVGGDPVPPGLGDRICRCFVACHLAPTRACKLWLVDRRQLHSRLAHIGAGQFFIGRPFGLILRRYHHLVEAARLGLGGSLVHLWQVHAIAGPIGVHALLLCSGLVQGGLIRLAGIRIDGTHTNNLT